MANGKKCRSPQGSLSSHHDITVGSLWRVPALSVYARVLSVRPDAIVLDIMRIDSRVTYVGLFHVPTVVFRTVLSEV